jgi:branched-chain amino acid transport system substrate-binding protein
MKKSLWLSTFAALASGLLITGCGKKEESAGGAGGGEGETIKVGQFASITGGNATFGTSSDAGTKMAIEEINAAGGVLGKKIELITEDDQSKAGEAGRVVEKLVSKDKVIAVLGEVASSKSLEAAPICQDASIPMISPASTNPKVTETGDFIFRICFIDPFQGTVMAKYALETGAKNVAVFTDIKQDYSVGLADNFKAYFTANGGTIVSDQKYSSSDKDFRAQLTAIKGSNPQAIFVPGYYTEVGLIAKQARELGITVPLLGGDGWDSPELPAIGGTALENTFYSNHYSSEDTSPLIVEFVSKYKAKYNGQTPDAMAALGYDSAKILAEAITRAGSTEGPALRDAIAATKDYKGVTGVITLNENRDATKPAVILQYKDGKYSYVATVAP